MEKAGKKRIVLSILLGIYMFLAISFDIASKDSGSILQRLINSLHTYGLPGNIFVLGLTLVCFIWLSYLKPAMHRFHKVLILFSVIFGVMNTAALYMFYRDALPILTARSMLLFIIIAIAYMLLFIIFGSLILKLLLLIATPGLANNEPVRTRKTNIQRLTFFIILIGWLPWLISYYPASMEWDVYYPLRQFLGEIPPNNQHPWFYACVIGFFYKLGLSLGDKNIGIFLYTVIRALIMAGIYARCVGVQKKTGIPDIICVITIVFYAFTPIWGAYAKHAFKDTFSAAAFCWYILTIIDITESIIQREVKLSACMEHAFAGLAASLFRNNMIYAVAPTTLVLFCYLIIKKQKIGGAILLLTGLIMFEGYQYYIFDVMGIDEGSIVEALSVPVQQTARTVKYHDATITEEEKDAIKAVLNYDNLAAAYDPIISDPVKGSWHGTHEEHLFYMHIWAKMFLEYPKTYIEAFVAHSSGYYAFTPEYTEEQRYGPGSHYNVGMTVFNWVEDGRFSKELTCSYSNSKILKSLRSILDNWVDIWHQIPILNLTDMKPLYTWIILLIGYLMICRKAYQNLIPVGACFLLILTCIASPVNDCFRYYAPIAATFPALLPLLKDGKS